LVVVGDIVGAGEAQERGVVVADRTRRLLGNLLELDINGSARTRRRTKN
jgi:hypothetical protein